VFKAVPVPREPPCKLAAVTGGAYQFGFISTEMLLVAVEVAASKGSSAIPTTLPDWVAFMP